MESRSDDLTLAWHDAQVQLPRGWTLDSLRCASTGLAVHLRSDDWVAVAIGPHGQHTEHRAAVP